MPNRTHTIGGTDIAAILGLSPYKTAFDVFAEKTGLSDPQPETRPMRLGKRLEPVLLEEYELDTGLHAEPWQSRILHPDIEIFSGTPDAIVSSAPIGVETKTAGVRQMRRWGDPGTDQIPEEYLMQVLWYCMLTEFDRWDVAVLLGGQDFRVFYIRRNRAIEDAMRDAALRFWHEHVVPRVPPEIDGSESARLYVQKTYARNTEPLRHATDDEVRTLLALRDARAAREAAQAEEARLETSVKASIGLSDGVEWDSGRVTWKLSKPSQVVEWEAIARSLGATPELVKQYTTEKPGSRRFLFKTTEGE